MAGTKAVQAELAFLLALVLAVSVTSYNYQHINDAYFHALSQYEDDGNFTRMQIFYSQNCMICVNGGCHKPSVYWEDWMARVTELKSYWKTTAVSNKAMLVAGEWTKYAKFPKGETILYHYTGVHQFNAAGELVQLAYVIDDAVMDKLVRILQPKVVEPDNAETEGLKNDSPVG